MRAKEIKDIRHRLELSQEEFADLFEESVRTIREWETPRREKIVFKRFNDKRLEALCIIINKFSFLEPDEIVKELTTKRRGLRRNSPIQVLGLPFAQKAISSWLGYIRRIHKQRKRPV